MDSKNKKNMPAIGLLVCNSASSNSGALTGVAAIEMIKEFPNVGIFSLPALANKTPRQLALIKKAPFLLIIDGCKNECAKKIAENMDISYDAYLNLEFDLEIKKLGPFTTLQYSRDDVERVKESIRKIIGQGRKQI